MESFFLEDRLYHQFIIGSIFAAFGRDAVDINMPGSCFGKMHRGLTFLDWLLGLFAELGGNDDKPSLMWNVLLPTGIRLRTGMGHHRIVFLFGDFPHSSLVLPSPGVHVTKNPNFKKWLALFSDS